MAGGSHLIWICSLLFCVFEASDTRHIPDDAAESTYRSRITDLDRILSKVTLPDGIDPKNVNVTFINVKSCTGLKEQLELRNIQLQQATQRNSQLDNEAFGLRREVRHLNLQLATCSSTASAITGSYQAQLINKLNQLLQTYDSDPFQILKIYSLTREINVLDKKIKHAANSTDGSDITALLRKQQEKKTERETKMQQLRKSNPSSALILQIIVLQSQIWELEQATSKSRGETNLQVDQRIQALQGELDAKISELRGSGSAGSTMMELITVQSRISSIQRRINIYIEKSRTFAADYQRQWRQKIDLLKKKIMQLNSDENNIELTHEILKLQSEVDNFRQSKINSKKQIESQLQELRVILDRERIKLANLQKQMEEEDYSQAQLIMRIIGIVKEVRELGGDDNQPDTTSTSQATTLQTLLQAKEKEFAVAQAEINELRQKLQLKIQECSGIEDRYHEVMTEFEQKIEELNRSGGSKAALILNVINLHDELKTLRELISTTQDPERISELQRQLREKENQLNAKTAEIKKLIPDPQTVLTIIQLQNQIWNLQSNAANETAAARIEELQNRLDNLLGDVEDTGDDNTKLMLKIITLQNQVDHLQTQMSNHDLQTAQIIKLRNDLNTKKEELLRYKDDLNEKNQTNGRLIITVTKLQSQLREIEEEKKKNNETSSLSINQLREQLKQKVAEHSRDQAKIGALNTQLQTKEKEHSAALAEVKELQKTLQSKTVDCSRLEKGYKDLKTEFEDKIAVLNRTRDSNAALILNVINLHEDLKTLRELISTTQDPERISELQSQLKEKQEELNAMTAHLERLIPNPKIILTIIELQNEIWDLQTKAGNGSADVGNLQDRVQGLLTELTDTGDDNTKLILKIITLQSQVEQLQKHLSELQSTKSARVNRLTILLQTKEAELKKYINELNEKNQTNAQLIMTITDVQNQLRHLETDKKNEGQKAVAAITKLREQLREKEVEHSRDQNEIRVLQNKLNETEAKCSSDESKIKDLQTELDAKLKELESQSSSVTTLALQVSTLSTQLEGLKRQLANTEAEDKIKELQKIIDEKNAELAKKTEELKERSSQPHRLLQIVAIQTEIEKLSYVAVNDTDYNKLRAFQEQLNYLIAGLENDGDENTKLTFQIMAQLDQIARLKQQQASQTEAASKKIKELEEELEDVRNNIREKTKLLGSTDVIIANLSSQIMQLHKKIKPLEMEISDIKETNAENIEDLQKRISLASRQLKDSEQLLRGANDKNLDLIMQIANLKSDLKKAKKEASRAIAAQNSEELEEQLQTQLKENRKLENKNKDLQQEIEGLKVCCNDANPACDDLERQLKQSQEDADRLQQQLNEDNLTFRQLQEELEQEAAEKNTLQHRVKSLEQELELSRDNADWFQQQLIMANANLTKLQEELEALSGDDNGLQQDNNNLKRKNADLEAQLIELQNQLIDVEDKTIHPRKMTFDRNTANPRIALSADNTEMSTAAQIQNVPDNPGRFDTALAVLGATGFSSGRNYWELSVDGKSCYQLGMASETAQRKGLIRFLPTNGYWTIVLNKQGQYRAIDRKTVILPVVTQPVTLGILLNYKQGEMSFYDAGTRAHLYTFVGQTFTGKIYPFVNFCIEDVDNPSPIVLRAPGSVDWIK